MEITKYIVNQGHGPQPNTDRDIDLIHDYLANVSMFVLCSKYKIRRQRIDQIRSKYGIKARQRIGVKNSKSKGVK